MLVANGYAVDWILDHTFDMGEQVSTDLKAAEMDQAFEKRFGVKVETVWNIFSNSYVTTTMEDTEAGLIPEQVGWLKGWSDRSSQA